MLPSPDVRDAHAALLRSVGADLDAVPQRGPADVLELGRLGPLPCWSMSGSPLHAASLARTLARRGHVGLLVADEPAATRRTLVAAVTPVRPVVIAVDDHHALPVARLRRLDAHATRLGVALAVATALDVDAAGRRAVRALRQQVGAATDALDGRIRQETRHAWVLLQVTRLLFLRFVESEGWLGGDPAFLRRAVDATLTRSDDPAGRLLHPLFFGTLNRPMAARSRRAREFGVVPFLNGGLFEPHPLERAHRWQLPVQHWRELFALIVDGIEVTLDAGDAGDRVNPELLGRVFEGVMHPVERRAEGTYYTPAGLVPPIVRESYACHLAGRLGRDEAAVHDALDDPDRPLSEAMLQCRVLDPAVGSGAFLVGALQLAGGHGADRYPRTRRLVVQRLFGVDCNPAAVRLTELRLWLELLRTMRGRPAARLPPLPNLDTSIRAGDALLDPLAGAVVPGHLVAAMGRARRAVISTHGSERRRATATLRATECDAMRAALERNEHRLERAVGELLEPGRAATLFGESARLPRGTGAQLAVLRRALRTVRRERRRLADHGVAPIFAIETAYAAELARGGFDLIVGNPPWVRAERLPAATRRALAARYRWWRGTGRGWQHLPDLSVAFLERSIDLLAPGGTVGLLLPAKLATARYATTCRAAIAHRTVVHCAADLSNDPRAGFEATTYPMAIIATRRAPHHGHLVRTGLGLTGASIPQLQWRQRGTWPLAAAEAQAIADALAARHPALAERFQPALGVKTGANDVFLDPPATLAAWTRSVLRGRDLAAGRRTTATRLLWPAASRGEPLAVLPGPVLAYLLPHRARLEARADQRRGPWWQLFRTGPATARWRVTWSDLARRLRPLPLEDPEPVPLNSCYVIGCADRQQMLALAAWLRSTPIAALARLVAEPAASGFARFGARAVGSVPLPHGALTDPALTALAAGPDTAATGRNIDRRVAALLDIGHDSLGSLLAIAAPGG